MKKSRLTVIMTCLRISVSAVRKISLFALLFLFVALPSYALTNDAESYLSFDADTSPYADDSGNGKTGARFQGAHSGLSLLGAGAYDTNNNGYVNMTGTKEFFNGTTEFSLSMWINGSFATDYIWGIGTNASAEMGFQISGGVIYYLVYNGSGGSPYCHINVPSANVWHHIVLTYHGGGASSDGKAMIWYDGVRQSWTSCTGTGTFPSKLPIVYKSELHLGTQYDGTDQWDGKFDEVALYSRNITADEISELYNGGVGFNPYSAGGVGTNASIDIRFYRAEVYYMNATFNEGDSIAPKINYTFKNITIADGVCNISVDNATIEYEGDSSFTLCGSGCDYSSYTLTSTSLTTSNAIEDELIFDVCHTSAPSKSLTVSAQCGTSHQEVIAAGSIPICPTVLRYEMNVTFCTASEEINFTFDNGAAGISNSHSINDTEHDRKYSILLSAAPYNATTGMYNPSRKFEFYRAGLHNFTANCSNGSASHVLSENITIDDDAPDIFHTSISVSGNIRPFTALITINISNVSDVIIFENVHDTDLSYYESSIINSTGGIIYNSTYTTEVGVHTVNGSIFYNDTFNFTTIAYDTDGTSSNLTTRFVVVKYDRPPIVSVTSTTPYAVGIGESFDVDFDVVSTDYLKNCSLWTNETGNYRVEDVRGQANISGSYSFNHSINASGRYGAYVECYNVIPLMGTSGNFSITVAGVSQYYNTTAIDNTRWFNTEILDASTTAGVLMYFFLLTLLIGLVVFAEFMKIPAFMILVGILFFFYGLLIYIKIAAIVGIMIYLTAAFYIARGVVQGVSDL